MVLILEEILAEEGEKIGFKFNEEQIEKFKHYYKLLIEENKKINLTRITEEKEVAVKHILDSLTCFLAVDFKDGYRVVDVGSGAGFPGIPIKIYQPGLDFVLIEATGKKVKFLERVIKELKLKGIMAVKARVEELSREEAYRGRFDVAVTRAVGKMTQLWRYCFPLLQKGGFFIAQKGPNVDQELKEARSRIEANGGEIKEIKSLTLPLIEEKRSIIVLKKIR